MRTKFKRSVYANLPKNRRETRLFSSWRDCRGDQTNKSTSKIVKRRQRIPRGGGFSRKICMRLKSVLPVGFCQTKRRPSFTENSLWAILQPWLAHYERVARMQIGVGGVQFGRESLGKSCACCWQSWCGVDSRVGNLLNAPKSVTVHFLAVVGHGDFLFPRSHPSCPDDVHPLRYYGCGFSFFFFSFLYSFFFFL